MHILYLHQYFCPPGGSGNNRSFELAKAWVAVGHQVTMVTSTAYFPSDQRSNGDLEFECEGIQVIALDVPYSHFLPFWKRIKAFLQFYRRGLIAASQLERPDLIYASSTPPTVGELGRKLAKHWKIPYVFETVDVWPDVPVGMGILKNRMAISWLNHRLLRIYIEAAAIVALSDGMRDQILSHGVDPNKVRVHYNGTNLEAFPFQTRVAKPLVHLVYTGTVGHANGVDVIPRLCKRLEELGRDDIHCTVLGDGNALAQVKALAEELALPNLTFLPTIPKEAVCAFLADADAGLVTFAPHKVLEANSANKFYDYLASGLPVVINYRGWQADYLKTWECGLSSDQGDLEGFVQNVLKLADDPELRQAMGKQGRALAAAKFDRQEIAKDLLLLFQGI